MKTVLISLVLLLCLATQSYSQPAITRPEAQSSLPNFIVPLPDHHTSYTLELLARPPQELNQQELMYLLTYHSMVQAEQQAIATKRMRGIRTSLGIIAGGVVASFLLMVSAANS